MIKTNGVPYCDTFQIDEEWTVLGLGPQSKACVFRSTYAITMLKSTMMKSIICQNTQSESKKSWDAFTQWVYQTNQHQFIEKKRSNKSSTATHQVERIDQRRIKKKKEQKPAEKQQRP